MCGFALNSVAFVNYILYKKHLCRDIVFLTIKTENWIVWL